MGDESTEGLVDLGVPLPEVSSDSKINHCKQSSPRFLLKRASGLLIAIFRVGFEKHMRISIIQRLLLYRLQVVPSTTCFCL